MRYTGFGIRHWHPSANDSGSAQPSGTIPVADGRARTFKFAEITPHDTTYETDERVVGRSNAHETKKLRYALAL